jgi:magnesium chelatase family protein
MNPCKCGFPNDPTYDCGCSPAQIQQDVSRISGPLVDRTDIHIDLPAVKYKELASSESTERKVPAPNFQSIF